MQVNQSANIATRLLLNTAIMECGTCCIYHLCVRKCVINNNTGSVVFYNHIDSQTWNAATLTYERCNVTNRYLTNCTDVWYWCIIKELARKSEKTKQMSSNNLFRSFKCVFKRNLLSYHPRDWFSRAKNLRAPVTANIVHTVSS